MLTFFERLVNWFTPDDAGLNQRERAARRMLTSVSLITTNFALLYVPDKNWKMADRYCRACLQLAPGHKEAKELLKKIKREWIHHKATDHIK